MKLIAFIILGVFFCFNLDSHAQTDTTGVWVGYEIINGDTLLMALTPEASVIAYSDKNYRESYKYKLALRRIKKVYPYAMLASEMYKDYTEKINDFDKNRQRKKYLKSEEKALKEKFEGKIRDITIKEGIILVKLIDRETSHTSYQVLKELKGGGSAFLWQGIARIFDSSLKHEYDPHGDDWMIEEIVQRIRQGEVSVDDMTMN